MRRVGAGTIAALLGPLLLVAVAPAQSPTYKPEPADVGSWWSNLFGSKPKEEPAVKPDPAARPRPTTDADRQRQLNRMMKAYERREAVCDRLKEIARETGNVTLEHEAATLYEMAWKLHEKQSQRLLGVASGPRVGNDRETARPTRSSTAGPGNTPPGDPLPVRNRDSGRFAPEMGDPTAAMRGGE